MEALLKFKRRCNYSGGIQKTQVGYSHTPKALLAALCTAVKTALLLYICVRAVTIASFSDTP